MLGQPLIPRRDLEHLKPSLEQSHAGRQHSRFIGALQPVLARQVAWRAPLPLTPLGFGEARAKNDQGAR